MKITRRHLLKIIQEEAESVCEGKKASKSKGKPYKGSRRGKTESQAQQMAAGIALSARRKHGKKGAIKKLRGAPKSMADMSMKDLVKLATIRRGSEVPDSAKKGHERAALPGHIAESHEEEKIKITHRQLRQIIKEELRLLESNSDSDHGEKLDPDLLRGAYVSSKEDREAMKDYIAKLKAKKKSMDSDGDGALDADELRAIADDLEDEEGIIDPREMEEPLGGWAGDALTNDPALDPFRDYNHNAVKAAAYAIEKVPYPAGGLIESEVYRYLQSELGLSPTSDEIFALGDEALSVAGIMLGSGPDAL
tara:strand:- start:2301 stop:3224 length:924 start_codon:yes stop_codon:yes gene_type:complete